MTTRLCLAKYAALTPKVPEGEEALPADDHGRRARASLGLRVWRAGSRGSAAYTIDDDVASTLLN